MSGWEFNFTDKIWASTGAGAWYFITLPVAMADKIKFLREKHRGFGTIRVVAKIGETEWKTSLFPDTNTNSYLLPIKAAVRRKENITSGCVASIAMKIDFGN